MNDLQDLKKSLNAWFKEEKFKLAYQDIGCSKEHLALILIKMEMYSDNVLIRLWSDCHFQKICHNSSLTENELTKILSNMIVKDGEGATKFVEICASGLDTDEDCLEVAYTVAHSPLVKTALFASDANWGRILAAVGRSKVNGLVIENINIYLNNLPIITAGELDKQYTEEAGSVEMSKSEIVIRIEMGKSSSSESVWTTDLSYDYVKINAEYRT